MKKQIRLTIALVMLVTLVSAFALCAEAIEPSNEGGHWVINAEKIDEILAGEAGEKTTGWEVPFMNVPPTLDGKITKGEYHPFELYEDYLSYMAIIGTPDQGNTKEEFMEFYEMTNKDFFDAYWGWDGRYLYLAFEVRCVNGFNCKPEEMGGNVYLYAYNMMQLGIAPVDATGKDPDYVELGFGVHSDTGEPLTQAWMGPYKPVAGEDFMGTYDKENQVVVYEARVHLQTALKLKDKMVENGDEINLAWLLSVNGETSSVNNYWQVGFCHGIGGQYSHKMNQYFARVTFTGKDVDLPPEEIPGVSEEDLEYELVEFVDMTDEKAVKSFADAARSGFKVDKSAGSMMQEIMDAVDSGDTHLKLSQERMDGLVTQLNLEREEQTNEDNVEAEASAPATAQRKIPPAGHCAYAGALAAGGICQHCRDCQDGQGGARALQSASAAGRGCAAGGPRRRKLRRRRAGDGRQRGQGA